jgi:LPS O-antigen subunit length determinant protein (WzzB/FepE family)
VTDKECSTNNINSTTPQHTVDGIDIVDILGILGEKKKLIGVVTILISMLSILYTLSISPTYETQVAFLKPQESFIPQVFLNSNTAKGKTDPFYNETSKSLYYKFLTRVQSYEHQRMVFDEGHFRDKFIDGTNHSEDIDSTFLNIHNSISLNYESRKIKHDEVKEFEEPLYLTLQGSKPMAISEFLNAISRVARDKIKSETLERVKNKVNDSVKNNIRKTSMLNMKINKISMLVKRKIDFSLENNLRQVKIFVMRLSDIQSNKNLILSAQIKDKAKALAEIKSRVKNEIKSKIRIYEDSLRIAKSLKIKNPNFNIANSNKPLKSPEPFNKDARIPIWFLYGELALAKEIEILKARVLDKDFIDNLSQLRYDMDRSEFERLQNIKRLEETYNKPQAIDLGNKYKDSLIKLKVENQKLEAISKSLAHTGVGLEVLKRLQIGSDYFADENKLHDNLNILEIEAATLKAIDTSLIEPEVVVISQPSSTPTRPIKPNRIKIVLIGTAIGLLISIFIAFLSHSLAVLKERKGFVSPS